MTNDAASQALADIAEINRITGEKKHTDKSRTDAVAAVNDLVQTLKNHDDVLQVIATALGETLPHLKARIQKAEEQGRALQSQVSSN